MAAKPFIAARIPEDLNAKLEEHSKATGEGKTQVLINALSSYLKFTSQNEEVAKDRLSILEKRFAELEERFDGLERIIKEPPRQFSLLDSIPDLQKKPPKPHLELVIRPDNDSDNKTNEELITDVINADNVLTEMSDNKNDNVLDNNRPADSSARKKGSSRVKPLPQRGSLVRSKMNTKDVPNLPELAHEDPKKIKVKLNNAKNTDRQATLIGPYIVALAPSESGSTKSKQQELLWDVYEAVDTPSSG